MTWIRIDPNEMEAGSRELQSCSEALGGAVTALQGQAAGCSMPAAVSAQVDETLATVERQLHEIRVELLLEATILALRGILAVKGSAVAGTLSMDVPAPTTGFVGGNPVGGFTITNSDGSPVDTSALYGMGGFVGGTSSGVTGLTGDWMSGMVGGSGSTDFVITNPDGSLADPNIFAGLSTVSAPTSPSIATLPAPLFNILNDANAHIADTWNHPSRSSLSFDEGRYISPSEYEQRGYRGLVY